MSSYVLAILASFVLVFCSATFIAALRIQNRLYGLAVSEFHDALTRIMRAPEDIPDHVLELIEDMNRTIVNRSSPWTLFLFLRQLNKGKRRPKEATSSKREGVQPELVKLVDEATYAWFSAMRYHSLFLGALLDREVRKRNALRGKLSTVPEPAAAVEVFGMLKVRPRLAS
ncbi:MAG: hypothetical protein O9248_00075 [Rhodobacteraceae bacterium]|nr:hypothetical protein [Paracoccaceae bacterium]